MDLKDLSQQELQAFMKIALGSEGKGQSKPKMGKGKAFFTLFRFVLLYLPLYLLGTVYVFGFINSIDYNAILGINEIGLVMQILANIYTSLLCFAIIILTMYNIEKYIFRTVGRK